MQNDILRELAAELKALRSEISTLKTDVENLKNQPVVKQVQEESEEADIDIPVADTSSDGGFFGGDDDDDTIALSGDELDDILNSDNIQLDEQQPESDFEEPVAEQAEEADFSEPTIEEPVVEESAEADIDIPVADTSSDGGFFGGDDDDDTIALSGDELDDILDTANFTEEAGDMATAETVDNDILVESSDSEDLMGETKPASDEDENDYDSLFTDDDSVPASEENIPSSDISEEDAFAILGDEEAQPLLTEQPATEEAEQTEPATEQVESIGKQPVAAVAAVAAAPMQATFCILPRPQCLLRRNQKGTCRSYIPPCSMALSRLPPLALRSSACFRSQKSALP